jgi:hypothetical protein
MPMLQTVARHSIAARHYNHWVHFPSLQFKAMSSQDSIRQALVSSLFSLDAGGMDKRTFIKW